MRSSRSKKSALEILIASTNKGKVAEISSILTGARRHKAMPMGSNNDKLKIKVISLKDLPSVPEPKENGKTFFENALIKARYYSKQFGLPVIADDSGLEVSILEGRPGIHSARYSGKNATDEKNNRQLLAELTELKALDPDKLPRAHFVAVLVLYYPNGKYIRATGKVYGHIAAKPMGDQGFGYDPIFIPDGYDQTFAQLGKVVKNEISHRSRALNKLKVKI